MREYSRGRTPIPCVRCNTFTKFRDLLRKADAIDADFIATGHYARVIEGALHRGSDPAKDQSYFLWGLQHSVLGRMLLPVGELSKAETRGRARALGLEVVAEKVESQDICFVPDGDHARVIASRLGPDAPALQPGPVLLSDGRVVGQHDGFARYTIGQRRGLPAASPSRCSSSTRGRSIVIGPREDLLGRGVAAAEANWLGPVPRPGDVVQGQIRHRSAAAPAVVVRADQATVELAFETGVSAVTPGQSLVLYEGTRVLGGGVIDRPVPGRRALPMTAA